MAADDDGRRREILPNAMRRKGHTLLLEDRLVFLVVGFAADNVSGLRIFVDALGENHAQVHGQKRKDGAGKDEDVEREEARQSFRGDDRPAEHQIHEAFANEGNTTHDGGADSQTPISILIPAHHLPRKRQAQGAQHEYAAGNPSDLARILVGAKEKNLRHVEEHDSHHEIGSPIVHGPHKPSKILLVGQIEKTLVGFGGGGDVSESQQAAR